MGWFTAGYQAAIDQLALQNADLRQRLDQSDADRRHLTDQILQLRRDGFSPARETSYPSPEDLPGVLDSRLYDEIELAAVGNRSLAAHLERFARIELGRGAELETVIARIRDGDPIDGVMRAAREEDDG